MRKGKDIGDHSYSFSGGGGALTVKVTTEIVVKVPLIRTTAYSFKHTSVERWKGGTLQQLSSATNDDGTPHSLQTANKGALMGLSGPMNLRSSGFSSSPDRPETIDQKLRAPVAIGTRRDQALPFLPVRQAVDRA
ncbi:DUF6134 family protein [Pseudophaeobacter flagellatus]|uniref:DUF6134 family protein n=1 Tax=Pseudophaeobacter flagellatus TaxID=2899119 RepID=UPI001E34AB8B|nr:DUF6134 family protein [Pseudophaeobacter flagellatus]MCD9147406.1 DUF6134 family protein [Pseudophaeobacter flagellatus]